MERKRKRLSKTAIVLAVAVVAIVAAIAWGASLPRAASVIRNAAVLTNINYSISFTCWDSSIKSSVPKYQILNFSSGSIKEPANASFNITIPFYVPYVSLPITLHSLRISTPNFTLVSVSPPLPINVSKGKTVNLSVQAKYLGEGYSGPIAILANESCIHLLT